MKAFWRASSADRNRWILLLLLAVVGFVLGYIGLHEIASDRNESTAPLTLVYRDITLASFSTGNVSLGESVPSTYQVARFLLPAVLIYGAFAGLTTVFRERFQRLRLPFVRGHVVIAGLGGKGLAFAEAMRADGDVVVAIEIDPANPHVLVARQLGAIVILGDACEPVVLSMAGVRRARRLLATADDATNVDVVVNAQTLSASRHGEPLECLAHAVDPEVCALLKIHALDRRQDAAFTVDFFNYYDQAARFLLRAEPPTEGMIVVVGSGPLADQVVEHLARSCTVSSGAGTVTLVAPDAEPRARGLESTIALRAVVTPLEPASLHRLATATLAGTRASILYLCHDDDDVNVAAALAFKTAARATGSRIVVCSDRRIGLETLLAQNSDLSAAIRVVPLVRETCTRELVDEGIVELLGRAIHEAYVESRREEGWGPGDASIVPWEELADSLKASNRAQAADIGTKLGAIGCGLVPAHDFDGQRVTFTGDEIEFLARMEHDRWVAERVDAGWRSGARDPDVRTSPYLIDWGDLPEWVRDRDRETVTGLPNRVNAAGFEVVRLQI